MYKWLTLIRQSEEQAVEYHSHSPLCELPHSSIGQEAISVGCTYRLRQDDYILPSLRTRGAFMVKGIEPRVMMAGAFGKDTGAAHGKNTSHHMADKRCNVVLSSAVLSSHVPVAVGTAMASKLRGEDSVTVTFFGDGSSNRGDVHEAMNMAAIYQLPLIFIIENNMYALSTPASYHSRLTNLADRAAAYGIPGVVVDGNDLMAVCGAMDEAVERARGGGGPTVMECKTYRFRNHSERDFRDLRPMDEVRHMVEHNDCRKRYAAFLTENGMATPAELSAMDAAAGEKVAACIRFAEESPFPDPDAHLLTHVYAEVTE